MPPPLPRRYPDTHSAQCPQPAVIRQDGDMTAPYPPNGPSRIEREKRRHRWENLGLLLVAIGVAALVFVAVAVGTH